MFAGTPISFDEARAATEASTPASTPLGFEVTLGRKTRHEVITSPNVVGIVRGTDPELADEYVVFSAHLDHNGIGAPVDGDAIYNGAYDNAMGSALMIETARVFAASPRRNCGRSSTSSSPVPVISTPVIVHHAESAVPR